MQIITDYCAMRNARALSACEMHTGPIKCRLECVFIILVLFIIPVSHIQLYICHITDHTFASTW